MLKVHTVRAMKSDSELIAALRKEAAAWFNNATLLMFEELIRRYENALRNRPESESASLRGDNREYVREGEIVRQEGVRWRVRVIGLDILLDEKDMELIQ
jgi:hypothetical protein